MFDSAATLASPSAYADAVATAVQAAAVYYTDGATPLGDDDYDALVRAIIHAADGGGPCRRRLDAAATVIAALHHDNEALREHLDARAGGNVRSLSARRGEIHDSP